MYNNIDLFLYFRSFFIVHESLSDQSLNEAKNIINFKQPKPKYNPLRSFLLFSQIGIVEAVVMEL
jgi:hypothetical protein